MKSKKLSKKLLAILLILVSIAIIIIAFVGIYLPKVNKLSNIIPDYKFGTELDGVVEHRFLVDRAEEEKEVYVDSEGKIRGVVIEDESSSSEESEEDVEKEPENNTGFNIETRKIKKNEDSVLTEENFEKAKKIIGERLERDGATEYSIRMDEVTGELVVELSQNDNIEFLYEAALSSKGKFEVIDNQTGVVLLDRSDMNDAGVYTYYNQGTNSYSVYLQIEFTDKGVEKFKSISNKYVQHVDEAGETVTESIAFQIDDSPIYRTYFDEEYSDKIINIPIGQNITNTTDLNYYIDSVSSIANILKLDELPIAYTADTNFFIKSSLSENWFDIANIVLIVFLVLIIIIFTIKFKLNGLVAGILNSAFIGIITIVLRYLGIVITFSSLISFFGILLINIVFMKKYLNKLKTRQASPFLSSVKEFYSIMVPIVVIAFVFTFFANATVTGVGYVLFWGLLVQFIYNLIITKNVLDM